MACPKGQYYCNTHKECRPIPDGCKVNKDGILVKEDLGKVVKGALTTAVQGGMSDLSRGKLTSDRVKNTIKKHGKDALRNVVTSKTFKKFLEQAQKCHCEGCDGNPCVECGENCHDVKEGALADRLKAHIKDKKKRWDKEGTAATNAAYKALKDVKDAQAAMAAEVGGTDHNINLRKESIERQAKDRTKLSQPHATPGNRREHDHTVDSAMTDHLPRKGKGRMRPASKKEIRVSAMNDAGIKNEISGKDSSIDLKKEETVLEWGWGDHKKAIEQRKIKNRKAVPYDAMLVKKKSETVAASHELKGDNLQELDRMGGPAALAGIVGAGIGLAKSGIDAVSKTAKKLQKTTKQKNNQLKMLEEVEGGVSVETYTKGIQFTEIETVDIIEPTRLSPSPKAAEYYDWRVELDK